MSFKIATMVMLICPLIVYGHQSNPVFNFLYDQEKLDMKHLLCWQRMVMGASFQGMFLLGAIFKLIMRKGLNGDKDINDQRPDQNSTEEPKRPLKFCESLPSVIAWIIGYTFFHRVDDSESSLVFWIPASFFFPLLALFHCCLMKEKIHLQQIVGILMISSAYFAFGFAQPNAKLDETHIFAFTRQCFCYLFIAYSIVNLEKLLKRRECSVADVLFQVGWLGMLCITVETMIFVILNAAREGKPITAEYLQTMFFAGQNFTQTMTQMIVSGIMLSICFNVIVDQSAIQLMAGILLFKAFIFNIIRHDTGKQLGLYAGFLLWMCVSYAVIALDIHKIIKENTQKHQCQLPRLRKTKTEPLPLRKLRSLRMFDHR